MTVTSANARADRFLLSCTSDFPNDFTYGPYSHGLLEQMMLRLKGVGVRRLYWMYYGDVDLASFWGSDLYKRTGYGQETSSLSALPRTPNPVPSIPYGGSLA